MNRAVSFSQLFFDRALHEARRYGEDPWIFVRELVQNSRDAGASEISFTTHEDEHSERVVCHDDGRGMDEAELQRYFLRLYASSKETNEDALGVFGVGFWSVLLFKPERIRVASRQADHTIAFDIHCRERTIVPVEDRLTVQGTMISLIRAKTGSDNLAQMLEHKLVHYVGHIRGKTNDSAPRLSCNGTLLNRPFSLPPVLGKRVRHKFFEGVVGFGPKPSIRLYKGGILVRDLVGIEELYPSRASSLPKVDFGLFHQVAVNADGLQLLMDRQTVFEDPLLDMIVDTAEQELLALHKRLVQQCFPINWPNRLLKWARAVPRRALIAVGLLLVCISGAYLLPWSRTGLFSERVPQSSGMLSSSLQTFPKSVEDALQNHGGSIVDSDTDSPIDWTFTYDSNQRASFLIATFQRYDPFLGFVETTPVLGQSYPTPRIDPDGDPGFTIAMQASGRNQPFMLPIPPNYSVVPASLTLNDQPYPNLAASPNGDPVLQLNQAGMLRYRVRPSLGYSISAPVVVTQELAWPEEFQRLIELERGNSPERLVDVFGALIRNRIDYVADPVAAARFNSDQRPWLTKSLDLGIGDCDVINGVLVLMLRAAGIPADLCPVLVGENGRVKGSLHATVRYFDQGWHYRDLTAGGLSFSRQSEPPALSDPVAISGSNVDLERASTLPEWPLGQEPNEPLAPRDTQVKPPVMGNRLATHQTTALVLLGGLLAAWLAWRKVRNRRPNLDHPQYIHDLFKHYLEHGPQQDPLHLRYRPIFPSTRGKRLSYEQLRAKVNRGLLFAAVPKDPAIQPLARGAWVLDSLAPVNQMLLEYLPSVTRLDTMSKSLAATTHTDQLAAIERFIRRYEPHFHLRLAKGSPHNYEWFLPLRRSINEKYFVIGERHLLFQDLSKCPGQLGSANFFQSVQFVLNHSSFFLNTKEFILLHLSRQTSLTTQPPSSRRALP